MLNCFVLPLIFSGAAIASSTEGRAEYLVQRKAELSEELWTTEVRLREARGEAPSSNTWQWGEANCKTYKCQNKYYHGRNCQCNPNCGKYGSCCSDFDAVCKGEGGGGGGKVEISKDQFNSSAVLPRFIGIGYNPDPHKRKANPPCDDFMSDWSETLWGPSGRNDLQIIKNMGADSVRTYGIGSHVNHKAFLDHAHKVGLKVMPGFADYPYLHLGSSCNIEHEMPRMPTDCIRRNRHDCFEVIKQNYALMLKNGYTYVNETDGNRYYHPAISTITVINECELKLQYNAHEGLGQNANHAKVVVTATDGLLSAEEELNITGPRPLLTATASYAACPNCKSVHLRFPGISRGTPFLPWVADYFLAFKDPKGFIGYTPKNNLTDMLLTRWVNSFNTPRPIDSMCVNENKALKSYTTGPLGKIPIYIGEFHHSSLSPQRWGQDVQKAIDLVDNKAGDICGKEENPLVGFNMFEYQVSYWKGSGSEGGTGMKYGFWGLGWKGIGKTRQDKHSVGWSTFEIYCLCPSYTGGRCSHNREDTPVAHMIKVLNGTWPPRKVLC